MSKPVCVICGNKSVAHQMCDKHYRRWKKYGDPNKLQRTGSCNRSKHPLYHSWKWFSRHCDLDDSWKDFADFRDFLVAKPSERHRLCKVDRSKKLGPENFYWKKTISGYPSKNEYMRNWRKKNPLLVKNNSLKRFGITLEDYHNMSDKQNNRCAICGEKEKAVIGGIKSSLAVDHCHKTGRVRGLLCSACNRGIGGLKDDPEILRKAADYLEATQRSDV